MCAHVFFRGRDGKTERFAVTESEKGRGARDGREGGVRQIERAGGRAKGTEGRGEREKEREKEGEHMCMLVTKGLGEGLREAR